MRIKATVTNGTMTFDEMFEDADIKDPERYMRDMLSRFNGSLRPGEKPRTLVSVSVVSQDGLVLKYADCNWLEDA